MRTLNSVKNIIASTIASVVTILIGLIVQKVFIDHLNIEYLGINGLFTNIVSMLGIVELGIGLAIVYSLYKPIANSDIPTVKSLMQFYKKSYRVVALIVAAIGLAIMPFLELVTGKVSIPENISFIYLLFLLDVILSYLLAYKRSMLYADQKNYIVNSVHTGYTIAVNILQMLVLIFTANFILYLVIKIIMRIIENIVLNTIADKRYPFLKEKDVLPLDATIKKDIFTKIKALFFHKIGSFIVLGSDNIIISTFLGVAVVGLYANYLLVITAIGTLVSQVFSAITASVGHLLVTSSPDKSHEVYKRVRFANFWLAAFVSIGLLVSMDSFVKVWIGEQFILPLGVLVALAINLYLNLFRSALGSFKEAAAIFHEDRFIPIVESAVNIVAAIVLLHFFGLAGVFMGTICSNFVLHLFSYPRYVYTKLFKRSYVEYYKEFGSYLIVALLVGAITFGISRMVIVDNSILQLATNVAISLVVPNVLFYILYRKSEEFNYFKILVGKMIRRLRKR
jgi:O-antigen/teichoic acid export membrane protein